MRKERIKDSLFRMDYRIEPMQVQIRYLCHGKFVFKVRDTRLLSSWSSVSSRRRDGYGSREYRTCALAIEDWTASSSMAGVKRKIGQ